MNRLRLQSHVAITTILRPGTLKPHLKFPCTFSYELHGPQRAAGDGAGLAFAICNLLHIEFSSGRGLPVNLVSRDIHPPGHHPRHRSGGSQSIALVKTFQPHRSRIKRGRKNENVRCSNTQKRGMGTNRI